MNINFKNSPNVPPPFKIQMLFALTLHTKGSRPLCVLLKNCCSPAGFCWHVRRRHRRETWRLQTWTNPPDRPGVVQGNLTVRALIFKTRSINLFHKAPLGHQKCQPWRKHLRAQVQLRLGVSWTPESGWGRQPGFNHFLYMGIHSIIDMSAWKKIQMTVHLNQGRKTGTRSFTVWATYVSFVPFKLSTATRITSWITSVLCLNCVLDNMENNQWIKLLLFSDFFTWTAGQRSMVKGHQKFCFKVQFFTVNKFRGRAIWQAERPIQVTTQWSLSLWSIQTPPPKPPPPTSLQKYRPPINQMQCYCDHDLGAEDNRSCYCSLSTAARRELRSELRVVESGADGAVYPRTQPATRLFPRRAPRDGEGRGRRPGQPDRRVPRQVLPAVQHDGRRTRTTQQCTYFVKYF